MNNKYYVIFSFRYPKSVNRPTEKYTIECNSYDMAKAILSDACSLDGVSYLKISTNKRNMKNRIVLNRQQYKQKFT